MKIKEVIENVDLSNYEKWKSLEEISKEFYIYENLSDENERLKSVFYQKWVCTDTHVGGRIYFLDNEAVCLSFQPFRKSDETFYWISKETFEKTHKYLLSLTEGEFLTPTDFIDLEKEIGETYKVEYSNEFLTNDVIYSPTKEPVKIVDRFYKEVISKKLEILFPNGERKVVGTFDLEIPYLLKTK